ncbi:MAG: cytochrome d ubiquinol oxidase subunit II [Deltaproteobacteria bacterium]|nr:cytochrome d ubiquinol oxidase subunit II [Deltaproteobacteria bacterium]
MALSTLGNTVFLAIALVFYILFGGADFGAGILELFSRGDQRRAHRDLIASAIAPVWEANHIWLILVVVILFVGFPEIYLELTSWLFIPLMCLLVGIILRGCAFTFRHYDTLTPRLEGLYAWTYSLSSLWSAFFLGILAGAPIAGTINPLAASFQDAYVTPWCNPLCFSIGLFTVSICTMLASVYLVAEANEGQMTAHFRKRARYAALLTLATGALVFIAARYYSSALFNNFTTSYTSILAFAIATVLLAPMWWSLELRPSPTVLRITSGVIVTLVLVGWYGAHFPIAIYYSATSNTPNLTFQAAASQLPTQNSLFSALIIGVIIIFPALFILLKIFKSATFKTKSEAN